MKEIIVTVTLAVDGEVANLDYVAESVEYALRHYLADEGITHESEDASVTGVAAEVTGITR